MNGLFRLLFLTALGAALLCSGCATVFLGPSEPSSDEQRYDDASVKTAIVSALLKEDAGKANDVNVHSFNGHVFLIGEADMDFRNTAMDVAQRARGVEHVTTHWFPAGTAATREDAAIEADVEARLASMEDKGVRRMAVDVWGGHVVLTGVLRSQSEINTAVSTVKQIAAAKSVTSYLAID